MKTASDAEVVREYVPLDDQPIHGVTLDGPLVWFARDEEIVAFDPADREGGPAPPGSSARAGTAFDGEHIYQLARARSSSFEPSDGRVVRRMPSPGKGEDSGMAWADGFLWIGQYRQSKIHKVDANDGRGGQDADDRLIRDRRLVRRRRPVARRERRRKAVRAPTARVRRHGGGFARRSRGGDLRRRSGGGRQLLVRWAPRRAAQGGPQGQALTRPGSRWICRV